LLAVNEEQVIRFINAGSQSLLAVQLNHSPYMLSLEIHLFFFVDNVHLVLFGVEAHFAKEETFISCYRHIMLLVACFN
jgi:hypothetical protein